MQSNFVFDDVEAPSNARCRLVGNHPRYHDAGLAGLNQGRMLFYLGENGYVKEFRLPSIVALLDRSTVIRQ